MLDLTAKTFQNILASMLLRISGGLNKREGSLIRTSLAAAAWAIEGLYIELANIQKQSFGLYATGQYLDYKAAERGLTRKAATAAVRRGIFDAAPAVGDRFAAKDVSPLLVFYVSSEPEDAQGVYSCELTCETVGSAGNSYSGDLLALDYVQGLTSVVVEDILIYGSDEESDDSLRARYIESMQSTPFAGNIDAYRSHILALDNVGAVQVWPTWQGAGTVLCSILDADLNLATNALIEAVQQDVCPQKDTEYDRDNPNAFGYGFAPIGAYVQIRTGSIVNMTFSADLTLSGVSLDSVKQKIIEKIAAYVLEVKKSWGVPVSRYNCTYEVVFYVSRFIAAMLDIDGVKDATNAEINGTPGAWYLAEDPQEQQVPHLSKIVISGTTIYENEAAQ